MIPIRELLDMLRSQLEAAQEVAGRRAGSSKLSSRDQNQSILVSH
jgi:hypothetical protein